MSENPGTHVEGQGHTKGPWLAAASPSSVVGWPVVAQGGRAVANVHYIHTKPEHVTETEWQNYRKQVLADAVLIAASPDMYAALDTFPMHEREDDAAYAQRVKRWWIEKGGPAVGRAQVHS